MVNLYKEGLVPLTQIHDEIAMSVTNKEQAKYIADIMVSAVPLEVPNVAMLKSGPVGASQIKTRLLLCLFYPDTNRGFFSLPVTATNATTARL